MSFDTSAVAQARRLARLADEPSNVIHVGVGDCEDALELKRQWPNARFIGIDPHHKSPAPKYPGQFIRGAVGRKSGFVTFYRRPSWYRSSMFSHEKRAQSPETMYAITLDMIAYDFNVRGTVVLWLDCEGSELFALMGGKKLIDKQVTWANIEIEGNYERALAPPKQDVELFMADHGFKFVQQNGRDAIYKKKDIK